MKGEVDACDLPLEARVPRLDGCCWEQKVGYGRDAAPKIRKHEGPRARRFIDPRGAKKECLEKKISSEKGFQRTISSYAFLATDSEVLWFLRKV